MAKPTWLQEVEDDATRITNKRFRDQQEEIEYQKSKVAEAAQLGEPEAAVKKGQ